MKTVKVRNVTLGEGAPKICVPMVGRTLAQLREEAEMLRSIACDLVEWRVDFFDDVRDIEKVKAALKQIRATLSEKPLLFTFRSAKEGGQQDVGEAFYFELNRSILQTGDIDLVDLELFNEENDIRKLVDEAHARGVKVVMSNHDFDKTPEKDEILKRLRRMQDLGADLPKIAVMPKSASDVLTLLDATRTMKETYADCPLITMSMGGQGVISRLSGEVFGSALTFGAAKQASAPGQINVDELRRILDLLHTQL